MKKRIFAFLLFTCFVGASCGMDCFEEPTRDICTCAFGRFGPPLNRRPLNHRENVFAAFLKKKEAEKVLFEHVFPCLFFFDLTRLERVNKRFRELSQEYKKADFSKMHLKLTKEMFCPDSSVSVIGTRFEKSMHHDRLAKIVLSCAFVILAFGWKVRELLGSRDGYDFAVSAEEACKYPYMNTLREFAKNYGDKIVGIHFDSNVKCTSERAPCTSYYADRDSCPKEKSRERLNASLKLHLKERGVQEKVLPLFENVEVLTVARLNLEINASGSSTSRYDVEALPENLRALFILKPLDEADFGRDLSLFVRLACRCPNLEELQIGFSNVKPGFSGGICGFKNLRSIILDLSRSSEWTFRRSCFRADKDCIYETKRYIENFIKNLPGTIIFLSIRVGYSDLAYCFCKNAKDVLQGRGLEVDVYDGKKYVVHSYSRYGFKDFSVSDEKLLRNRLRPMAKSKNMPVFAMFSGCREFCILCPPSLSSRIEEFLKKKDSIDQPFGLDK